LTKLLNFYEKRLKNHQNNDIMALYDNFSLKGGYKNGKEQTGRCAESQVEA
jgi:hypothetical protein